jgi:hypothetical protein
MHLVDNLVPLSSRIADDEAMENFISLLGFSNRNTLLGLKELFVFRKRLLPNFLLSFSLDFRELKKGFISLLTSARAPQAFIMSDAIPFSSMMCTTAMTSMRYSSLFPYAKAAICKLVLSGILTLICSASCLSCRSA